MPTQSPLQVSAYSSICFDPNHSDPNKIVLKQVTMHFFHPVLRIWTFVNSGSVILRFKHILKSIAGACMREE
jgi:hypothetical protein